MEQSIVALNLYISGFTKDEIKECPSKGIMPPLEASKWILLVIPFHFQLQKVEVELIG
jgi:hypothetical protein